MTTPQPEHPPDAPQSDKPSEEQNQNDIDDAEQKKLDEAIEMTFPASDPLSI